ncbi:MAG: hypothetical protein Q7O66_20470 [Dehalococcoidia bacterium]|nr:hypothetical protein [Dehalococcoidia bacterium]
MARTTSKYGNVYFDARRDSSLASSGDSRIWYGLFLGMMTTSLVVIMPQNLRLINFIIRYGIYEMVYLAFAAARERGMFVPAA